MSKMFTFLLMLALVAVCTIATMADSFALPVPAEAEKRLNLGDVRSPGVQLGYQVFSNKEQVLRCKYDYAVLGGASGSSLSLKAVDGSTCSLPNKAIVVGGIIDVITAPTTASDSNISVSTGQGIGDLRAANWSTTYTGQLNLTPVYTAATAIKLTAARTPSVRMMVAPLTGGKFNVYIKYLLGE